VLGPSGCEGHPVRSGIAGLIQPRPAASNVGGKAAIRACLQEADPAGRGDRASQRRPAVQVRGLDKSEREARAVRGAPLHGRAERFRGHWPRELSGGIFGGGRCAVDRRALVTQPKAYDDGRPFAQSTRSRGKAETATCGNVQEQRRHRWCSSPKSVFEIGVLSQSASRSGRRGRVVIASQTFDHRAYPRRRGVSATAAQYADHCRANLGSAADAMAA